MSQRQRPSVLETSTKPVPRTAALLELDIVSLGGKTQTMNALVSGRRARFEEIHDARVVDKQVSRARHRHHSCRAVEQLKEPIFGRDAAVPPEPGSGHVAFDEIDTFVGALRNLGFEKLRPHRELSFIQIIAANRRMKPVPKVALQFRGHHRSASESTSEESRLATHEIERSEEINSEPRRRGGS